MNMKFLTIGFIGLQLFWGSNAIAKSVEANVDIVTADEIKWGYLNPLRGDKSPGAADLWGDRTKDTATGMLVRFNKGFSSPPHIHNITYRGIVIKGKLHNDDPSAETMWLSSGSYWQQPAGESHITAANGEENLIYLEINSGPYLVMPSKKAFDNGERPVNVDETNLVWQSDMSSTWVNNKEAKITYLWGKPQKGSLSGSMLKLSDEFSGQIATNGGDLKAVVISGTITYKDSKTGAEKALTPGSYFHSIGDIEHLIKTSGNEAMVYIRAESGYKVLN